MIDLFLIVDKPLTRIFQNYMKIMMTLLLIIKLYHQTHTKSKKNYNEKH